MNLGLFLFFSIKLLKWIKIVFFIILLCIIILFKVDKYYVIIWIFVLFNIKIDIIFYIIDKKRCFKNGL